MKKFSVGELWTGVGDNFATKPRPMLIVQEVDDPNLSSEITAVVTSEQNDGLLKYRHRISATPENGLEHHSYICLDKIQTIPKSKFGEKIGKISDADMHEIRLKIADIFGIFKELEIRGRR